MKTVKFARIDDNLWKQVKAQAALDGKSIADWVEEALKKKLEPRYSHLPDYWL